MANLASFLVNIKQIFFSFINKGKIFFFYKNNLREIKNYSNLAPLNSENYISNKYLN